MNLLWIESVSEDVQLVQYCTVHCVWFVGDAVHLFFQFVNCPNCHWFSLLLSKHACILLCIFEKLGITRAREVHAGQTTWWRYQILAWVGWSLVTPHPQTACCMGMRLLIELWPACTSLALVMPNFSNMHNSRAPTLCISMHQYCCIIDTQIIDQIIYEVTKRFVHSNWRSIFLSSECGWSSDTKLQ